MQKEKREIFVSQKTSEESEKYCTLFSSGVCTVEVQKMGESYVVESTSLQFSIDLTSANRTQVCSEIITPKS